MKHTNATTPTFPVAPERAAPPQIASLAEGKAGWMRSMQNINGPRWKELGYEPAEDVTPVWAGRAVVTDGPIADDSPDDLSLLIGDDPNAALALRGGSLEACDEATFHHAMAELQRVHRVCLERGRRDDAARVRDAIDNARAERRRQDPLAIIDAEERAALDKCQEDAEAAIARAEAEWAGRQAQFRRPSPALAAMRKAADRLSAAGAFDTGSGLARQIAEREAEEGRIADQRIAEGRDGEVLRLRAQYEAARAGILAEFEQGRRRIAGSAKPRPGLPQPEIVRPLSSRGKT
jgi:hypothetical protein